ncbi:replication initiator protein [Blackfly microvirus SF02]|uniref:Replication initiator protein n=1 Tax=Blackfly microvirus SF02 TaxID=2576452 RepID=A0A4P8PJS7_9VIRU|nr:replication initiator protein [Blackfly microvirus SF02]
MPCYNPLDAYRALGSGDVVFDIRKGDPTSKFPLPCNNCVGCRLDKARQWAIRLTHERREHDLAIFVTLTYNDQHLPRDGGLVKKHMQTFFKRLRSYIEYTTPDNPKIKYFMCGEYGGKTLRPHYHAIIFGMDFADKRFHKNNKQGDKLYTSKKLDELWGMGHCNIGDVTYQSVGYVARYNLKKVNGVNKHEHYKGVNRDTGEIVSIIPEFIAASQGLGLAHFERHHQQMYMRDSVVIQGKEAPVPKYYDVKLKQVNEEWLAEIKAKRLEKAMAAAADNTRERLKVREEIKTAQVSKLTRDLHDD